MATQLGELQIESIDGDTLRGWFKSVYEQNVYGASKEFGAQFLEEAWEQSGSPKGALSKLLGKDTISLSPPDVKGAISDVTFETPHETSTFFEITVNDPDLLSDLELIYWESYLLG